MAVFGFAIGNSGEGVRPGGAAILTSWKDRPGNRYNSDIPYVIGPSGAPTPMHNSHDSRFRASGFWLPPT